jgi:hypothetical protein
MTIYATPHGTATPNPYAARIAATEGASVVTCCNHNCNEGGRSYRAVVPVQRYGEEGGCRWTRYVESMEAD